MQWVRLDTAFPRNHKVLALMEMKDGHRAIVAYICGLSYCGEQDSDGFIPRNALPFLHARAADAKKLVDVRLWLADPGGWVVNGWSDFQPSSEENRQRSIRARAAAAARWGGDSDA